MSTDKRKNEWAIEGEGDQSGRLVGAAILIGLGLLFLLMNFAPSLDLGQLVLIGLGGVFLVAAFLTRSPGLVIPGCILSGIGVGVWLIGSGPAWEGLDNGAVILICMGVGFAAIMPLTRLVGGQPHWWPLIPGGILGGIGLLMTFGEAGLSLLEQIGRFWPVVLILIGLFILLRGGRPKIE